MNKEKIGAFILSVFTLTILSIIYYIIYRLGLN